MADKPRSVGNQRRFNLLLLSATTLAVSFPLVFNIVTNKTWLTAAFLIPAVKTGFALSDFDGLRSSLLVVRPSITLEFLSWFFSLAMFIFTMFAGASTQVWFLISVVYIGWGWMFELGIGLATKFRLARTYSSWAAFLPTAAMPEEEKWMWCTTVIPFLTCLTLVLDFISWKFAERMFPVPEPEMDLAVQEGGYPV